MISHWYTHKIGPARKEKASDPQKQRVYRMEREWIGSAVDTTVPLDKLRAITKHACRAAGVRCPKVRVYRKKERIFGYCTDEAIMLNASFHGQNLAVLLHELAHWITDRKYPDATSHGPWFCTVYRQLLDDYRLLPAFAFDGLAEKWGVEHNGI